jgi:hypothetical protein
VDIPAHCDDAAKVWVTRLSSMSLEEGCEALRSSARWGHAAQSGCVVGLISSTEGAIAQEVIDLMSILNSLRMILPTGFLTTLKGLRRWENDQSRMTKRLLHHEPGTSCEIGEVQSVPTNQMRRTV